MASPEYMSFIEQTLHYFDRPHDAMPETPVVSKAAWRGASMPSLSELAYELSPEQKQELQEAVLHAVALGRETRTLTAADFPLPAWSELVPGRERTVFLVFQPAPGQPRGTEPCRRPARSRGGHR